METNKIYNMDCLEGMKQIESNSIDSIVTDPPYELGFMSKSWDASGIAYNVEMWKEAFRVLKPGGYLLSFGGTRTYHRMACAIEDAGFEIRDQIQWVYGSGFPKSLNIGKAIDKLQGNDRKIIGEENKAKPTFHSQNVGGNISNIDNIKITKGTSEWEGWGTALKPAHEPIVVARKPLAEKSVAENVLKYGTGGINIDESRIEATKKDMGNWDRFKGHQNNNAIRKNMVDNKTENFVDRVDNGINNLGRFPANVIHDGSDEVLELFPDNKSSVRKISDKEDINIKNKIYGKGYIRQEGGFDDSGSAARFFYCAKASKSERNEGLENTEETINCDRNPYCYSADVPFNRSANPKKNIHPTVKPLKLMEYLVKLVTPKGGVCLDPFMGSGTTAVACKKNGFKYLGFEKEAEYIKIINARLSVIKQKKLLEE